MFDRTSSRDYPNDVAKGEMDPAFLALGPVAGLDLRRQILTITSRLEADGWKVSSHLDRTIGIPKPRRWSMFARRETRERRSFVARRNGPGQEIVRVFRTILQVVMS